MVEVRKREGEPVAGLVRRFSYRVQKSGILLRAKGIKFHQKPKTKIVRKKAALRRIKKQANRG